MLIALELPCLRAAWGAHLVSGPGPLARLVWVGSSTATLCWFHLATSAFALFPRSFMPALPRFSWVACVLPRCSTLVLQLLLIALSHLVVSGCGVWDGVLWGLSSGRVHLLGFGAQLLWAAFLACCPGMGRHVAHAGGAQRVICAVRCALGARVSSALTAIVYKRCANSFAAHCSVHSLRIWPAALYQRSCRGGGV